MSNIDNTNNIKPAACFDKFKTKKTSTFKGRSKMLALVWQTSAQERAVTEAIERHIDKKKGV